MKGYLFVTFLVDNQLIFQFSVWKKWQKFSYTYIIQLWLHEKYPKALLIDICSTPTAPGPKIITLAPVALVKCVLSHYISYVFFSAACFCPLSVLLCAFSSSSLFFYLFICLRGGSWPLPRPGFTDPLCSLCVIMFTCSNIQYVFLFCFSSHFWFDFLK